MRRRHFITLLGSAVAWPLVARAQRTDRTRRVGVLMALAQSDPEAQLRTQALEAGLRDLGWVEGRNLRLDYCFVPDASRLHAQASELVGLAPDLILAVATPVVAGLLPVSRTLPIVFVYVTDPVGSGFVPTFPALAPDSLASPASSSASVASGLCRRADSADGANAPPVWLAAADAVAGQLPPDGFRLNNHLLTISLLSKNVPKRGSEMEQSLDVRIRERAYEIWNAQGCPEGRADEHWLTAEREILTVPPVPSSPSKSTASRKSKVRAQLSKSRAV
jgi:hypothetical protein